VAALAIFFAAIGWLYRQHLEPHQQCLAVERQLQSLAMRRPVDLSPRQWESAVAWTLNLHGNSLLRFQAGGPAIRAFNQRLTRKLSGDVNLTTIHWIWDQYAVLCPGGSNYQRFREQMDDEIKAGGADWGMNVP
jgi:hypothetical protein